MNVRRHLFNFIVDHHARWRHFPTHAELCRHFANLTGDVDLHLEQLQREGLLQLDGKGDRTISIPHTFPTTQRINLYNPLRTGANSTEDSLVRSSIGLDLRGAGVALDGDLFAQVVGDNSMIDAGIASKDVAILKVIPPERGEIVAVLEKGRLVLRRYVIIADIPHFLAENPMRPALTPAYDEPIHGVLWCLICIGPNGRSRSAPPIKQINYVRDTRAALKPEFVEMLKAEMRKQTTAKQRGAKSGIVVMLKPKTKREKNDAKRGDDWPQSPSGIGLNDRTNLDYCTAPKGAFRDEQPDKAYGTAFTEALARAVVQQAKSESSISKPPPSTSGFGGSSHNAHGTAVKVAPRAQSNQTSRAKSAVHRRSK